MIVQLKMASSTAKVKNPFKQHQKDKAAAGYNKLHHADSPQKVIKYLNRGMLADDYDEVGDSPIHFYMKRKDKQKFEVLMAFLIHSNCTIDMVNQDGMTALHLACERNDLLSTKALIAFEANLNIVNYENCTPLDIVTGAYKSASEIPLLLESLDGVHAEDVKSLRRQESDDYNDGLSADYLSNPMESYFETLSDKQPLSDVHQTVRTRFGLDSQLLSLRTSMGDSLRQPPAPVMYHHEPLEFHDGREERNADEDRPPASLALESLPEEKDPTPVIDKLKNEKHTKMESPDASIEMALTEVSIMLAKEKARDIDTPESSVTSGTSVLRKNPFLSPRLSPSPLSVSPASPHLEESQEEEQTQKSPEDKKKHLEQAYIDIYSPSITPGSGALDPYQPVKNPMSLEKVEETQEDGGVPIKYHAGHKTAHVHFAESPSPEERHLYSYTHLDGSIFNQFENHTKRKLDEAVDSSLDTGDEGYAAWLQWKEMERARKWREELNAGLESTDQKPDTTTPTNPPPTTLINGQHMLKDTNHTGTAHPNTLPLQTPPPKPPTKRRANNAPAATGVKRKLQLRQRRLRLHSPMGSMNMMTSLVNPHMTVMHSILGSSVAPLSRRQEKGERILCLDGGGIKGLIQIEILKHIEMLAGKPITELFDWIVGTSTGGIVALGLVYAKRSLDDLKRMYFELKDTVFKKKSKFITTACDTDALEELLIKTLGSEMTMKSESKPKVMITAVDKRTTDLPLVFFNNCFDNDFNDQPVWKVARYTSAAPLYFKELDNYVDGGVVANNPCQYAMAEIQSYLRKQRSKATPAERKHQKKFRPSKISCVVSIGCGIYPPEPIGNTDILDAMKVTKITSAPQKLKHLVTLLTSTLSKSDDVARLCQSSCEEQEIPFYRLSPKLGDSVGTAETDNEKLCDIIIGAKKLLVESEDHLSNLIEHLGCELSR